MEGEEREKSVWGGQNNQVVLTTVTSPMNDGTGSWYLA